LVEYWPVKGVFWRLKQGLKRPVQQVMDGLDTQKRQVGEDKQEVHRAQAFALADPGSGQKVLDMQPGKQFLDPQFQVGADIFQGRLDLPLKESDFVAQAYCLGRHRLKPVAIKSQDHKLW